MKVLGKLPKLISPAQGPSLAAVVRLFFPCRPSAVFRGVIPIVVNSLQRFTVWNFSHVGVKILECLPARANLNSTAAVISPRLNVFIPAPIEHVFPYSIDCCPTPAVGSMNVAANFLQAAAARLATSIPKRGNVYRSSIAAFTQAISKAMRSNLWRSAGNGPPAKLFSNTVFEGVRSQ